MIHYRQGPIDGNTKRHCASASHTSDTRQEAQRPPSVEAQRSLWFLLAVDPTVSHHVTLRWPIGRERCLGLDNAASHYVETLKLKIALFWGIPPLQIPLGTHQLLGAKSRSDNVLPCTSPVEKWLGFC